MKGEGTKGRKYDEERARIQEETERVCKRMGHLEVDVEREGCEGGGWDKVECVCGSETLVAKRRRGDVGDGEDGRWVRREEG